MKNNRVALSMNQYGIGTVVLTYFDELEKIRHKFNSLPDNTFFNGKGKKAMHDWLLASLRKEDAYFNKHLYLVSPTNKRWLKFLDDCAILAVLSAFVKGTPIYLIRPEEYEKMKSKSKASSSSVKSFELMQELPSVLRKSDVADAIGS